MENKQKSIVLRVEAEALLQPSACTETVPRSAEELLKELQIYQIELEIQNEELRHTQLILEESRNRYLDLYDFAPVGYLTLTHEGLIAELNLTASSLFGLDRCELLHSQFATLVAPQDGDDWYLFFSGVKNQNNQKNIELTLKRKNDVEFPVQLDVQRVISSDKDLMLRITLTDITESRRVEALKVSEQRFRDLVNTTDGIVWEADAITLDFTFVSQKIEKLLGYSMKDWLRPIFWKDHLHSDDHVWSLEYYVASMLQLESHHVEYRFITKEGRVIWLRDFVTVVAEQDMPRYLRGIMVDITDNKLAEQQLRIAATAFETQEGIMISDANNVILRVNNAFSKITGYTPEEVIGKNPNILNSGYQNKDFYAAMWASINDTGVWEGEIWNRRKNGDIYPEHLAITVVKDESGFVINYVASLTDITMSKAAANEIERLAFHDTLTGLPNRQLLLDRLKPALALSNRNRQNGALLFIDMDNFKTLNDSLGHDMGDLMLQLVGQRLSLCVREGDTVARLGGDEFVVILEGLSKQIIKAAAQTKVIGNNILTSLNQPYQLDSHTYRTTSSIGATLFIGHNKTIDELLKQADIAMYQAKALGRNNLCFFDPKMQEIINARVKLEADLYLAFKENQFLLYYQPQVYCNHQVFGAEVLIRWQHPEYGLVFPVDFIPIAEETGLILSIGEWVLETACAQLKLWESGMHTRHLVLAVNVSSKQFYQACFVEQVCAVVEKYAIRPERLKLELTESVVLSNIDDTIIKMLELKKIGVHFSMDDFGTGYSSLSYLTQLPLNQLKIDRSFVRNMGIKHTDAVIVQTIIGMANNLGMEIIAEGVETEEQRVFLEQHGCTAIQGYLFSKPVPIEQFESFLLRMLKVI
jgi:diguanylate cyclase (GGDEF)-like protein/PAS domain S-box-containing protein